MVKEPQRTYLIELITALGSAADDFVLVGAQAMSFDIAQTRPSKDCDFVLNVIALRQSSQSIDGVLKQLNYSVVSESRNFQFTKDIPGSPEKMRIEFLASDKQKRPDDFRVDVKEQIHARECAGAEIVLAQSESILLDGRLPDGNPAQVKIRVAKPNAILMMKLLAMDDRYRNLRGPDEARHDRERARVHTADGIIIVRTHIQNPDFKRSFWAQFGNEAGLRQRIADIIPGYFKDLNAPGIQLYREFMSAQKGIVDEAETNRALREMNLLL